MVWGENLTVIPHCLQEVIEEMDPGPVVPDGGMRHNKLVFQLVIRGGVVWECSVRALLTLGTGCTNSFWSICPQTFSRLSWTKP